MVSGIGRARGRRPAPGVGERARDLQCIERVATRCARDSRQRLTKGDLVEMQGDDPFQDVDFERADGHALHPVERRLPGDEPLQDLEPRSADDPRRRFGYSPPRARASMIDDSQQAPPANTIEEQDPMDAPPPQRPEDESEAPEDVTPGPAGPGAPHSG